MFFLCIGWELFCFNIVVTRGCSLRYLHVGMEKIRMKRENFELELLVAYFFRLVAHILYYKYIRSSEKMYGIYSF